MAQPGAAPFDPPLDLGLLPDRRVQRLLDLLVPLELLGALDLELVGGGVPVAPLLVEEGEHRAHRAEHAPLDVAERDEVRHARVAPHDVRGPAGHGLGHVVRPHAALEAVGHVADGHVDGLVGGLGLRDEALAGLEVVPGPDLGAVEQADIGHLGDLRVVRPARRGDVADGERRAAQRVRLVVPHLVGGVLDVGHEPVDLGAALRRRALRGSHALLDLVDALAELHDLHPAVRVVLGDDPSHPAEAEHGQGGGGGEGREAPPEGGDEGDGGRQADAHHEHAGDVAGVLGAVHPGGIHERERDGDPGVGHEERPAEDVGEEARGSVSGRRHVGLASLSTRAHPQLREKRPVRSSSSAIAGRAKRAGMDLPLPTARRDRLLVALLAADPSMVLLRWDPEIALLFSASGPVRVLLITVPPGLPPDVARARFAASVKAVAQPTPGSPPTHLVAVGGGPEVAAALAAAAPMVEPVPMGFHHLDDAGALAHVKSRRLPMLERAAARPLDAAAPFDPQPIAAALARGRQLVGQERVVAARLRGRYVVTAVITAVCVALAGLGYLWGGAAGYDQAIWRMGANEVGAVRGGEPWRLLASAFLHGGGIHLAVNMYALWMLGPMIEAILGRRRYILLYGASALGGSLASAFLHAGAHSSVGASGAIWGLMTAYLALAYRPKGIIPPQMALSLRRQMWLPVGLSLVFSFKAGIDMLAHLGGGAVGFVLTATVLTHGLVPMEERRSPADVERRPGPRMTVAAAVVAVAMGASVVAALVTGRPWETGAAPVLERTAIGNTGLSLEVPAAGAHRPEVMVEQGMTRVDFGSLREQPVMFEAVVAPLIRAPRRDELDSFLEKNRQDLDQHAPPKWKQTAPAKRIALGDLPAIVVEHDANADTHVKSYQVVVGANEVLVRAYAGKERPKTWEGIEEKVVATVR